MDQDLSEDLPDVDADADEKMQMRITTFNTLKESSYFNNSTKCLINLKSNRLN